ncbi:MAG TPA: hypothetical protein VMM76_13350, partial [Pirellulaceae bacterium]|nr:hypothetical protein [Pirellulaceae bacterium]
RDGESVATSCYNAPMPSERDKTSENPYEAPRHPSHRQTVVWERKLIIVAVVGFLASVLMGVILIWILLGGTGTTRFVEERGQWGHSTLGGEDHDDAPFWGSTRGEVLCPHHLLSTVVRFLLDSV